MEQLDMFGEIYEQLPKWNKPLSVMEFYGGIGSQLKALKNIGISISNHTLIEVDIDATISYASIHCDLNEQMELYLFPTRESMIQELEPFHWWRNDKPYNINKLKLDKLQKLYLSRTLTNNLGDVFKLSGEDLPQVDLITWSTPCQDFSLAGKQKGFDGAKGGLTYITLELFKQLKQLNKLPKFMLFENVPAIVSEKFKYGFDEMTRQLQALGYENNVLRMNAKDYGIPQNRDRVFILSIHKDYLQDYYYEIPKPIKLELRLRDLLEDKVDDKYYLSDKMLDFFKKNSEEQQAKGNGFKFEPKDGNCVAKAITTRNGSRMDDNFIKVPEATERGYKEAYDGDGIYLDRPHQKRGTVQKGMTPTLKTSGNDIGVVTDNLRIRKLTPLECWRLMGFADIDFFNAEQHISDSQLYKQAGNSIVVNVLEAIFKNLLGGTKWE